MEHVVIVKNYKKEAKKTSQKADQSIGPAMVGQFQNFYEFGQPYPSRRL